MKKKMNFILYHNEFNCILYHKLDEKMVYFVFNYKVCNCKV